MGVISCRARFISKFKLYNNSFTTNNTVVIFDTKLGKGKIIAINIDGNALDIYINDQTPIPVILTNNK